MLIFRSIVPGPWEGVPVAVESYVRTLLFSLLGFYDTIKHVNEFLDEEIPYEEGSIFILQEGDDVTNLSEAGLRKEEGRYELMPEWTTTIPGTDGKYYCTLVLFSDNGGNFYIYPADEDWLDPDFIKEATEDGLVDEVTFRREDIALEVQHFREKELPNRSQKEVQEFLKWLEETLWRMQVV